MTLNVTHLLVATAMLAAPAALGVATQTDLLEEEPTAADEILAAQTVEEGETVETYEGEVPEEVTAGELDLRIDHGAVKTVAWDQDRYKIEVVQEETDGSSSQRQTTVSFDESVEDGTIALELVVDREGPGSPAVHVQDTSAGEGHVDRAIVAHVPARLTYEQVHACEGESWNAPDLGGNANLTSGDGDCVDTDSPVHVQPEISVDRDDQQRGLNVTSGLVGLAGEEFRVNVDHGDLVLEALDVTKLGVYADHGDMAGTAVTAEEAALASDYGDVDLELDADKATVVVDHGDLTLEGAITNLDARSDYGDAIVTSTALQTGSITADHGDIVVDATPAATGDLKANADHGEVEMKLAHSPEIGYEAEGAADHGDVEIHLVDERSDESAAEDEEDEDRDHEKARTANYDEHPIQFSVTATSDHGDVLVREETTAQDAEDGEEAESGVAQAVLR